MAKKDYISNVYTALSENLEGFNKDEAQFREAMKDQEYASKVYSALSDNLEGFNRSEDEFYQMVGLKKKPTPSPSSGGKSPSKGQAVDIGEQIKKATGGGIQDFRAPEGFVEQGGKFVPKEQPRAIEFGVKQTAAKQKKKELSTKLNQVEDELMYGENELGMMKTIADKAQAAGMDVTPIAEQYNQVVQRLNENIGQYQQMADQYNQANDVDQKIQNYFEATAKLRELKNEKQPDLIMGAVDLVDKSALGELAQQTINGIAPPLVAGIGILTKDVGVILDEMKGDPSDSETLGDILMSFGQVIHDKSKEMKFDVSKSAEKSLFDNGGWSDPRAWANTMVSGISSAVAMGAGQMVGIPMWVTGTAMAADGLYEAATEAGIKDEKDRLMFATTVAPFVGALEAMAGSKYAKEFVGKLIGKTATETISQLPEKLTPKIIQEAFGNTLAQKGKSLALQVGEEMITGAGEQASQVIGETIYDVTAGAGKVKGKGAFGRDISKPSQYIEQAFTDIVKGGIEEGIGALIPIGIAGGKVSAGKQQLHQDIFDSRKDPSVMNKWYDMLDVAEADGTITPKQKLEYTAYLEKAQAVDARVPAKVDNPEARAQATEVLTQLDEKREEIENTDQALKPLLEEEAKALEEKLIQIATTNQPQYDKEEQLSKEQQQKLEANKKLSEIVPGLGGEKEVEAEIKGEKKVEPSPEKPKVILSGLRGGFKSVSPDSFDMRGDHGVQNELMRENSFAKIVTYKGRKYVTVGIRRTPETPDNTSGRDNYSFASAEYNESTPSNIVEILEAEAKDNFKNIYREFSSKDKLKPISVKDAELVELESKAKPQEKKTEPVAEVKPEPEVDERVEKVKQMNTAYNNMNGRQRKSNEGISLLAKLNAAAKEIGYSLKPKKTGGFTLLNDKGKEVRKVGTPRSQDEIQKEKREAEKLKKAKSSNPVSLEHAIALDIANGVKFDHEELKRVTGLTDKDIPFGYTRKDGKGQSLEFYMEEFGRRIGGTDEYGVSDMEDISKVGDIVASYMYAGGRQAATDFALEMYEKQVNGGYTDAEIEAMSQEYGATPEQVDYVTEQVSEMSDEEAQKLLDELTKAEQDPEYINQKLQEYEIEIPGAEPQETVSEKTDRVGREEKSRREAAKEIREQRKRREIAKRIRGKKTGGAMSSIDFGITVGIYNGALEFMAKQVESGTKLGNAIAKTIKWIDEKMEGKKWDKGAFAKYMNDEYKVKLGDGKVVDVIRDDSKETAEVINGFYLPIEQKILDTKQESLPANKWAEILRSKEDEDLYTGVREYLESRGTSQVTKKELKDFIKNNRIEIAEVVKGDVSSGLSKSEIEDKFSERGITIGEHYGEIYMETEEDDAIGFEDLPEDLKPLATDYARQLNQADYNDVVSTKYHQYQLPGEKENYKEVLITLPSKQVMTFEEFAEDHWGDISDLTENQRKIARQQYDDYYSKTNKAKVGFKSAHFDEPNILVHLRMNTRKDAEGNKVLFLEEVQSDWGQTGKKEGFAGIDTRDTTKEGDEWVIVDKRTKEVIESKTYNTEKEARDYLEKSKGRFDGSKIPTAPFVTDTNSWVRLGLKYALKQAVEQGADKLAWTTGEQQNERYDLSKQVESIVYKKNESGTYNVEVFNDVSGTLYFNEKASLSDIESVLGKDIAEKIKDNKGESDEEYYKESKILKGEGLKIEGKGMKGFYGSIQEGKTGILGGVVESLTGQKVGKVNIGEGEIFSIKKNRSYGYDVFSNKEGFMSNFDTENQAKEYAERMSGDYGSKQTVQPSVDITPEIKQYVKEGMPLFAGAKPKPSPAPSKFQDVDHMAVGESLEELFDLQKSLESAKSNAMKQKIQEDIDNISKSIPQDFVEKAKFVKDNIQDIKKKLESMNLLKVEC